MHSRLIGTVMVVLALKTVPAAAIMVRFPEMVGPARWSAEVACKPRISAPGGGSAVPAIPVRGLALGSLIDRNDTPFPTGGSGTARFSWEAERQAAGLQYQPRMFDPAGPARPSVFAELSRPQGPWAYQRLSLKPAGRSYSPAAMIYANATSFTSGRIASLAMVLPSKPTQRAKLVLNWPMSCRLQPLYIYSLDTSVERLRNLVASDRCNWKDLSACERPARPRGQVLFVQQQRSGFGYEHRWVQYDLLLTR